MFDLGIQELVLIFVVALLVFGPKRLPELGKSIGRGLRELKRAMYDIKAEVNSELYDIDKIDRIDKAAGRPESGEADSGAVGPVETIPKPDETASKREGPAVSEKEAREG